MVDAKHQAWLEERNTGVGASDAPDILLGEAFSVWAEKTGKAAPDDLDRVEAVRWGNLLEATVCEEYRVRSGRQVKHNAEKKISRHSDLDWMIATLDADQCDDVKGPGALEIKTTGYWPGQDWKAGPPLRVQIQLQHQIAVRDLAWGTICVLIAGQKMVPFDMDRNQRFIDAMIRKEAFFWTQVIDKVAPDPDGSIATTDTLKKLYPHDSGAVIALPEDAPRWDDKIVEAKAIIKEWEFIKRKNENKIKHALGDATTGVLPNGDRYTLKEQTVNYKAKEASTNSFRVLRRSSK